MQQKRLPNPSHSCLCSCLEGFIKDCIELITYIAMNNRTTAIGFTRKWAIMLMQSKSPELNLAPRVFSLLFHHLHRRDGGAERSWVRGCPELISSKCLQRRGTGMMSRKLEKTPDISTYEFKVASLPVCYNGNIYTILTAKIQKQSATACVSSKDFFGLK